MKRAITLTALLALLIAVPTMAVARSGSHVTLHKWQVFVWIDKHERYKDVAPGGTAKACQSWPMLRLSAYFTASGSTRLPIVELWSVNGKLRDRFTDRSLASVGRYFTVYNSMGLPKGKWTLTVKSASGATLGSSSITVRSYRC